LDLNERDLSRLARLGSGSASRSVPGGFVEWLPGQGDEDSYAVSIAAPDHWDLVDCIAVVSEGHKPTGSTEGHALAGTSLLQEARLAGVPDRLEACRKAILSRDFEALAEVAELDSNLMHAVMMTSNPPLLYWQPATVDILQHVPAWRSSGLPAFFTVDAGPNVHVFSTAEASGEVCARLSSIPGVKRVLTARAGGKSHLE
jgi:diphosphomevalonate decarboxylase